MTHHKLKTYPKYFDAVARGEKRFEIRRDDRNYQPGDLVTLQRFHPGTQQYTGAEMDFQIGYVLRHAQVFGIEKGHCVFDLKEVHS